MAYLQEIRIVQPDQVPAIGSTQDPNVIFIVPITDKVCDQYVSDNDGIIRATSVQTPIFNSSEEANAGVPIANRYEGKMVMIKKTYTNPDAENDTKDVYTLHWWKGGIADENLKVQAPDLAAVLSNGNLLPVGASLGFSSLSDPNVPPGFYPSGTVIKELSSGTDGSNFLFTHYAPPKDNENFFYINVNILGGYFDKGWGNIIVGSGLSATSDTETQTYSGVTALGCDALDNLLPQEDPMYLDVYLPNMGGNWGALNANTALGHGAGKGLKAGAGNIYIGDRTSGRPEKESNQLVIHSGDYAGAGNESHSSTGRGYALLRGDFKDRWFQVAGKLRLNKTQNEVKTDFANLNEIAVLDVTSGNHYKQMETVNAKEYILQQIEGMDSAQITRLKTALGI